MKFDKMSGQGVPTSECFITEKARPLTLHIVASHMFLIKVSYYQCMRGEPSEAKMTLWRNLRFDRVTLHYLLLVCQSEDQGVVKLNGGAVTVQHGMLIWE